MTFVLSHLPNLIYLDISLNNFGQGSWKSLLNLLEKHQTLCYVNIMGNTSLAYMNSKNTFESMRKVILLKVIWVTRGWIEAREWVTVIGIRETEEIEEIYTNFRVFYDDFIPLLPPED